MMYIELFNLEYNMTFRQVLGFIYLITPFVFLVHLYRTGMLHYWSKHVEYNIYYWLVLWK